jgi:ribosomal protein S18 acetylase RimI-like enzyme
MERGKHGTVTDPPTDGGPAIPGTDLVLRPARGGDANRILTLMREVFIDEMGWDRAFLVDSAHTLVQLFSAGDGAGDLFLVCLSGKKIVGLVVLRDAGEGTGFIRWLVVHRSARGIGLGRLLLERALAFAEESGFGRVRLVTVRDLSLALDFYRGVGFREVARKPGVLWRMPHELCFMELDITSR